MATDDLRSIIVGLVDQFKAADQAVDLYKSLESREKGETYLSRLDDALARCANCEILIDLAQSKIQPLIDRATNDIERQAREYQRDLIGWQLHRAAESAQERIAHLARIVTPEDQAAEKELCRKDTKYWFRYYAWSTDPRPDAPLSVMPTVPFPFQDNYIDWLECTTFEEHSSGLVEKSRDMGATVIWIEWNVKHWLFTEGFSSLLSSATEDLVDSKQDPDTLFEKTRFQIRMLPKWMLPVGFDPNRHMPYMNIANPENGSVITGQAPTQNIGRQRRRTVALCDEFASWPFGGYTQHTAMSQTVRCMFKVSSVKGRLNKFAEERHAGGTNVFTMDWREHPWKDDRWFNSLDHGYCGPRMTTQEVAQEVSRDYDASQPGKVFTKYNELLNVVTWKEFASVAVGAVNPDTNLYRIPTNWFCGRGLDWGATDENQHPAVCIWIAIAAENAHPSIRGCIFVYRERMWSGGPTVGEVAREIKTVEAVDHETERMVQKRISHERSTEQNTFLREHRMPWEKWQTTDNWGLSVINEFLEPRKWQHPFRAELYGSPRLYLIVADDQGQMEKDHSGHGAVVAARDQDGLKRLRAEMPAYHYPTTEAGKPVGKMKPEKFFDDAVDALRGVAGHFFGPSKKLSDNERMEASFPEPLRAETLTREIRDGTIEDLNVRIMQRIEARQKYKEQNTGRRGILDRYRGGR